jgi:hypothetical protein
MAYDHLIPQYLKGEIEYPRETTAQKLHSDPYVRLWSAAIYLAIRDLWSPNEKLFISACHWIYSDDLGIQDQSNFDDVMLSLGYDPDLLRKLMTTVKGRKKVFKEFNKQGVKKPSKYIDVVHKVVRGNHKYDE